MAAVYRERWLIELLFKALKQTLRIKTFAGTSANAVVIQIRTSRIAMLLVKYPQVRSPYGWSLSNLVRCSGNGCWCARVCSAGWIDPFEPRSRPPGPFQLAQDWD